MHTRPSHVELFVIACPGCKRRVFTRSDIWYAALDGTAKCRVCGQLARLDLLSRWILACMLAIILPMILLYGDVFYSGHFFVVSTALVLAAWRVLSFIGLPYLSLEPVTSRPSMNRNQSFMTVAVLILAAFVLDGIMAARIERDEALEHANSSTAVYRER